MRTNLLLLVMAVALGVHAQQDPIPGPLPDEYVDVTGDGIADLLITSRTVHVSDPQQPGYLGMYKLGVRTLSSTSILRWSTPSNQRWFTLDSTARLDTAELAARIHYKQLSWTDQDVATEFWRLERPFGPAITKEQDGWYGTGDHHDGQTLVLRNANERGTAIAAFAFKLPFPYGRIVVRPKGSVRVLNGYGEEGDPVQAKPVVKDGYDFGHEPNEPQVIVPPGLAPDEPVDLNDDGVADLVIRSIDGHRNAVDGSGYYVRGIAPLNGTAFLMTNVRWGTWRPYTLAEGAALTPGQLATGLEGGTLRWTTVDDHAFIELLRHPYNGEAVPMEWSAAPAAHAGDLVYRSTSYGRAYIGALELVYTLPGGALGVRPQAWVEEGQVLEVR